MNEADTRVEHIDLALKVAGWGVVDGSRVRRGVYGAVMQWVAEKPAVVLARHAAG